MPESAEERAKRLKSQRQRRWRVKRKLGEQLGQSQGLVLRDEAPADDGPWPQPGDGLPEHMRADMFGGLLEIGAGTISEAIRYTRYVQQMPEQEAMTPLRPGASPPNAEARLQRQAALQVLAQMAATPISAIRVLKDATGAMDLAAEAAAIQDGRSKRFPRAYVADGEIIIPDDGQEDGDIAG